MFRFLITAATLVGGGLALGRKALDREIESRVNRVIEEAHARASAELDTAIRDVVRRRLISLAVTLAVKAGLIAAAYGLFAGGVLSAQGFRILTAVLLAAYVIRDIIVIAPYLRPALRYARGAGWRPQRAMRNFVVGLVFERAYAEARAETQRGRNRLWIALSSHRDEALSRQVAQKVSEMAVDTSFARARTRLILAVISALVMMAAYSGFAILALKAG